MEEPMVISLGGNAFAERGESMTMAGQFDFAEQTLTPLSALFRGAEPVLVTHGNGPQVGYILTRVEAALGKAYELPLEVCVAESEGEIGYVLQQTIHNLTGGNRPVATLLTQVRVDAEDPAFDNPTKPIGPWFAGEHLDALAAAGFTLMRDSAGRGRRVVASPRPRSIVEVNTIRHMLALGVIVIAAGGGGIPVVEQDGQLHGVEAVADKDLATALLATEVGARRLVLVTGVAGVYRDFDTADAALLQRPTRAELAMLQAAGQFPAGTMGPKVEAALAFATATGNPAVICQPADIAEAIAGTAGTIITGA